MRQRVDLFLAFCARRGYNRRPLLENVHPRAVHRRERLRLSPSQMLDLLDVAASERDRCMIAVAINLALRASELTSVRLGDVNLQASTGPQISTVDRKTGLSSDQVLSELRETLQVLGYSVESGKTKTAKISRPVLFGDNGTPEVNYEIDAFHDQLGIAVEVEAGRGAAGNADYRDIVRTSLILDARFMALVMPMRYRTMSGNREHAIPAFERTRNQLSAIYASQRLPLPFKGVMLIGY